MDVSPPTRAIDIEIAQQPTAWQAAVRQLVTDRDDLPPPGRRVAVVGCGTSLYMARAYAERREAAGHGETDAFPASEFRLGRSYDRVVAITRSGTTTEVLDVLERLGPGADTLVITVEGGTPAGDLARRVVTLPMAAERSVVQTLFPTTTLALLRASLGEDLGPAIDDAHRAVGDDLPLDADVEQITFLGLGWAAGLADEAALKCREAAGFWTESYPAMEYRHGPVSVSGPGRAVWLFGPEPAGLGDAARATGAAFRCSASDPMAELIRAQRTAVALADREGRDPDHPQALTFSVVLDAVPE